MRSRAARLGGGGSDSGSGGAEDPRRSVPIIKNGLCAFSLVKQGEVEGGEREAEGERGGRGRERKKRSSREEERERER